MEPESVSDAQVFYGGHQFALALFLLFALRRRELLRAGLILVVLVQLTLTLSRLLIAWSSGLGIDTDATLYGLVYRGSVSLLAIFALYWLERGRREPEPAEPLPEAPVEKVRDADFEGL
jgi:peptidoglycan/LPS O-acetylase OafA/YrhL